MLKPKQYLSQAYRLDNLISSNQQELADLNELATAIKVMQTDKDKVKESNASSDAKFVEIIAKATELEESIKDDLRKLFSLKMEIRIVINSVKNIDERLLLKYRYINFYSWEEIHEKMHMSVRNIHRVHNSALNNVKIPK